MEDKKVKKIVKIGFYKEAPKGMMDRIMANLVVNPSRRHSVKPVEPKPVYAVILPMIIVLLMVVGVVFKPKVMFSFNWHIPVSLTIHPIWVAPVLAVGLTVWGYIIMKRQNSSI